MIARSSAVSRLIAIRMNAGEDLLRALEAAVREQGVRNGVFVGGAGSLKSYRVHVVKTTQLPPGETLFEGEEALDILTITGAVLDGRVHAHVTFSNADKAMGGHVHEGCRILTFGLAVLAETPNANLADWDRMGELKP
ncbi:MAG: DNA-binding protein [Candidatus Sumerlaeota bacterium]|nr:DNA-binding protein [Candidatus Sumerlaeota bacterium]